MRGLSLKTISVSFLISLFFHALIFFNIQETTWRPDSEKEHMISIHILKAKEQYKPVHNNTSKPSLIAPNQKEIKKATRPRSKPKENILTIQKSHSVASIQSIDHFINSYVAQEANKEQLTSFKNSFNDDDAQFKNTQSRKKGYPNMHNLHQLPSSGAYNIKIGDANCTAIKQAPANFDDLVNGTSTIIGNCKKEALIKLKLKPRQQN